MRRVLAALIALALAGCGDAPPQPATTEATVVEAAGSVAAPPMLVIDPPVDVSTAPAQDVAADDVGSQLPLRARPGGALWVFFGYTYCPDICPTTLGDLRDARAELREAADAVDVAMVTVDIQRDTPDVLRGYLSRFFDRYHAIRAVSDSDLAALEKPFGAGHEFPDGREIDGYSVNHTAGVYLVDEAGLLRGLWAYGTPPATIAADTRRLLDG